MSLATVSAATVALVTLMAAYGMACCKYRPDSCRIYGVELGAISGEGLDGIAVFGIKYFLVVVDLANPFFREAQKAMTS